jgi:dTDP-4-dehydrorhamnose 3,5-epimerase-like enzyme
MRHSVEQAERIKNCTSVRSVLVYPSHQLYRAKGRVHNFLVQSDKHFFFNYIVTDCRNYTTVHVVLL